LRLFVCIIMVLIIWLLLSWTFSLENLFVGTIFAILVGAFLGEIYPDRLDKIFNPRRWFWMLCYIPYFIYYCVKANLDVAYRVIHPQLPIRPGIIKVRTDLESEMAKTFLANSITLTPGTLTVDIVGQDFYVHWIAIASDDVKEQTRVIIKRFEPLLKRIFE